MLIFSLLLLLSDQPVNAAADGIAARVNGVALYDRDLEGELNSQLQQALATGVTPSEEQIAQFRTATLDKLVNIELLFQKSEKEGVTIDKEMIEAQFEKFKGQFPSEEQFKGFLTELGFTEDEVKNQFRKNFSVQQFIKEQFSDKAEITDMEIREFYDSNQDKFLQPESARARHILIKVNEDDPQEEKDKKRAKLENIRKEILGGSDFSDMAKRFSDCPSSEKGGDLGFFTRNQMVKPFETAAFGMMPGDVSEIVETSFGYHLIKLDEKRTAQTAAFDETKEQISGYLTQLKVNSAIERYVEGLRKEAEVKIF